jgi:hypothetical protein
MALQRKIETESIMQDRLRERERFATRGDQLPNLGLPN